MRSHAAWAVAAALTTATMPAAQPRGDAPADRHHHAMTYDRATRRVLLFGGARTDNGPSILSDLWSWNGRVWSAVAIDTGRPLSGHRLFSDHRGGVFVVGGAAGVTARWRDRRWDVVVEDTRLSLAGAAGSYDSHRRRYVLYGGGTRPGTATSDTWEFDGRVWSRVATTGPPAVMGAAMAYDHRRRRMLLFGGRDAARRFHGDTWTWDGRVWERLTSAGPPARAFHDVAYDSRQDHVVLFGGRGDAGVLFDDTWVWARGQWRRVHVESAPTARTDPMMAFDESRGVTVLFGGAGADVQRPTFGDTWEWNGARWRKADVSPGRDLSDGPPSQTGARRAVARR
jgi:hypothetical protein